MANKRVCITHVSHQRGAHGKQEGMHYSCELSVRRLMHMVTKGVCITHGVARQVAYNQGSVHHS